VIPLAALEHHLRRVAMGDLGLSYADSAPDEDGDICLPADPVPVYARLLSTTPPCVRLWSVAATGLKRSARLLREVNEINSQQLHTRVVLTADGRLMVLAEVMAASLEHGELAALARRVSSTVSEVGPLVQVVYGTGLVEPADSDAGAS
jgi:hypothetical protein